MENLLKIIKKLGHKMHEEIPIRQLSMESGVPNTTVHRLIKDNNLFRINQKGNIKLVSLKFEDQITKSYLIISERNSADNFLIKDRILKSLIKEIPKGNYCLVLFGSRASGKEREKSDYDILVINEKGDKTIEFSSIARLYDIEINPIYMKRKEFEDLMREKEHNLSDEIIRNHIILYGEEYFWNIVWRYRHEIRQR